MSSKQKIQGTTLWLERSHVSAGRLIKIFDDQLDRLKGNEIATVLAGSNGVLLQVGSMPWWSSSEARIVASALQQAATIAADFDAWWEQEES